MAKGAGKFALTDDHVRRLKMLENDVSGMGGESVILETVALDRGLTTCDDLVFRSVKELVMNKQIETAAFALPLNPAMPALANGQKLPQNPYTLHRRLVRGLRKLTIPDAAQAKPSLFVDQSRQPQSACRGRGSGDADSGIREFAPCEGRAGRDSRARR